MKISKLTSKLILLLLILIIPMMIIGCNSKEKSEETKKVEKKSEEDKNSGEKRELTIATAASLQQAVLEIQKDFEKEENCKLTFSFGATGSLVEQIKQGAPFDVLMSADEGNIDGIIKSDNAYKDTKAIYAIGSLGMITAKTGNIEVGNVEDLKREDIKKIAIANPETAPYGKAAKETLEKASIWNEIESKIVYGKDISEVVSLVETKNAEVGFLSASLKNDNLNWNIVDDSMYTKIRQAVVVTKQTEDKKLSESFIKYLQKDKSRKILAKYGYNFPEK